MHYHYYLFKIFRWTFVLCLIQHDSYVWLALGIYHWPQNKTNTPTPDSLTHYSTLFFLMVSFLFTLYFLYCIHTCRMCLFEPQPLFSSLLCLMTLFNDSASWATVRGLFLKLHTVMYLFSCCFAASGLSISVLVRSSLLCSKQPCME